MQEIFLNVYLILTLLLTVYTTSFTNWVWHDTHLNQVHMRVHPRRLSPRVGDSLFTLVIGIPGAEAPMNPKYTFQKYLHYTGFLTSVSSILLCIEGIFSL